MLMNWSDLLLNIFPNFIVVIPKKFGDVNRCELWGSCSIVPSSWSKFNAAFFIQHRLPVHELTSLSCRDKEGT